MNKKIIAVVGMPFAGKTEATRHIENKGYFKVYFGDATFDEIKRQGLETNEENEKRVRENLRKKYGMAAFAIISMPKIEKGFAKGNVVIESLYSWEEYKLIKEKYGDSFKVIAVFAPPKIRYGRVMGRTEIKQGKERKFNEDSVKKRDYAQLENLATGAPIAMADYTIINTGEISDLHKNIDVILKD